MIYGLITAYLAIAFSVGIGGYLSLVNDKNPGLLRWFWLLVVGHGIFWPFVVSAIFGHWSMKTILKIKQVTNPVKSFLDQYRTGKTFADIPNCEPLQTKNKNKINSKTKRKLLNLWFLEFGSECPDCGCQMNFINNCKQQATVDHIRARSLGGTHALNNLRICCKNCNLKKNTIEIVLKANLG